MYECHVMSFFDKIHVYMNWLWVYYYILVFSVGISWIFHQLVPVSTIWWYRVNCAITLHRKNSRRWISTSRRALRYRTVTSMMMLPPCVPATQIVGVSISNLIEAFNGFLFLHLAPIVSFCLCSCMHFEFRVDLFSVIQIQYEECSLKCFFQFFFVYVYSYLLSFVQYKTHVRFTLAIGFGVCFAFFFSFGLEWFHFSFFGHEWGTR